MYLYNLGFSQRYFDIELPIQRVPINLAAPILQRTYFVCLFFPNSPSLIETGCKVRDYFLFLQTFSKVFRTFFQTLKNAVRFSFSESGHKVKNYFLICKIFCIFFSLSPLAPIFLFLKAGAKINMSEAIFQINPKLFLIFFFANPAIDLPDNTFNSSMDYSFFLVTFARRLHSSVQT